MPGAPQGGLDGAIAKGRMKVVARLPDGVGRELLVWSTRRLPEWLPAHAQAPPTHHAHPRAVLPRGERRHGHARADRLHRAPPCASPAPASAARTGPTATRTGASRPSSARTPTSSSATACSPASSASAPIAAFVLAFARRPFRRDLALLARAAAARRARPGRDGRADGALRARARLGDGPLRALDGDHRRRGRARRGARARRGRRASGRATSRWRAGCGRCSRSAA